MSGAFRAVNEQLRAIRLRKNRGPSAAASLYKAERCGIDAIAQARGTRPVGEQVAQMRVASLAEYFGAFHE